LEDEDESAFGQFAQELGLAAAEAVELEVDAGLEGDA